MLEPAILFEDDSLIALDKPAGLIVHRDGRTQEPSVAEWLLARYPMLAQVCPPWVSPQGEEVPLAGIVHRLDRTTSGVLLAAKTPGAYAYLKGEFKAQKVGKRYLAYAYGHMEKTEGEIIAEIARTSAPPKRWYAIPCGASDRPTRPGRAAVTAWRLMKVLRDPESGEPASFLGLFPKTGRTHQIRVHLASVGHPIIADHLYAPDRPALLGFQRPALHAASVALRLPRGERVVFEAPLPDDFKQAARE